MRQLEISNEEDPKKERARAREKDISSKPREEKQYIIVRSKLEQMIKMEIMTKDNYGHINWLSQPIEAAY